MQTKVTNATIESLLPYLDWSGGNPSTRLSLTVANPLVSESSYPFCVLNDSSPTARLLEAAFVTDAGSVLKKVFLLLQKDRYSFREDELFPVSNSDIDEIWQQAFSFHGRGEDKDSGMVVLSGQLDDNGGLTLLAPMFYCRKREQFFHPPCPACGLPLRLCEDDDLLLSSGLKPYSGSLKRYLYCGRCSVPGMEGFYVNERDYDDPPLLRDRWSLIGDFALLRDGGNLTSPFPCIGCPEHDACFGSDGVVRSRVVPFSFYPFYLLIFDSLSLNAMEFLSLVSGAKLEEMVRRPGSRFEQERADRFKGIPAEGFFGRFFHAVDDKRYFVEVLYLKLSFLDDVLRNLLVRGDTLGHPDLCPTIDRIWVDLPNRSGLLPFFWNFRTRVMDVVSPPDTAGSPYDRPSSNLLFYLGLLWFHALLVNKKQGNKEIFPVLKAGLSCKPDLSSAIHVEGRFHPAFVPENIFWEPDGKVVCPNHILLWEKSLELGLRLLRTASGLDQWSEEDFLEDLERLRSEVKNSLLMDTPLAEGKEPVQDECHAGDDELCDILTEIIDKWREKPESRTALATETEDIEMTETVILTSPQHASVPSPPQPEEFTETVILSSKPEFAEPPVAPDRNPDQDPLPETIILSPEKERAALSETRTAKEVEQDVTLRQKKIEGEDDLEATVILPPRRSWEKGGKGGPGHG